MTYLAPTRLKPSIASRLSIGRAARLTGLTIRAIRFYEQRGLIEGRRDARDIRTFDAADLERLAWIAQLRAVGVGLDEIAVLAEAGAAQGLGETLRRHHDQAVARVAGIEALAGRLGVALGPEQGERLSA